MPKTKISEFSATPGNNTDIDGINIAEGCAPSGINDAIRELMAQLKDFQAGTAGDSFNGPVGTTTAAAGAFTTLSASSTVSGTGFSNYLASPPAIGGTAAAAGSFTTLTTSSTVTHNGGTANGVAYLNGSKVLTTGSALTFDGTGFQLSTSTGGNFYLNSTTTGTSNQIVSLLNNGNGYGNLNYKAFDHIWSYGATEQARLTSTGLGIGTSSPAFKLDVNGVSAVRAGNALRLYRTDNAIYTELWDAGSSGFTVNNANGNGIRLQLAGSTAVTLDSSGNLGLGVTPSAWGSIFKAIDFSTTASLAGSSGGANLFNNAYYNGSDYIYKTTAASTRYLQSSGAHYWYTAPSGTAGNAISFTQAMTLTAAGDLGVGTTSPGGGSRLHVDASGGGIIRVTRLASSATAYGQLENDGTNTTLTSSAALLFNAGGSTERARITSGGDLLVGTTGSAFSERLSVVKSGVTTSYFQTDTATEYGAAIRNTATSGDNGFLLFQTEAGGTTRGSITYNRGGGVVAYNTTSDYRSKDIIGPVANPGAIIDALKVYMGKMKGATIERPMMIAHEAQAVTPYAVTGEKDAVNDKGEPIYQAMDHQVLVPLLIAEIQSLRARVAQLEAK